ncbi:3-hydroxyisobutyrate dehydrogenase [Streptomyces zhaozhouensis]|uniref:3-hydroxyisobutyrate dehydrogenase n=1 Tax=Streptomyces zhaozhouensis TaxID=1300267 RepID=A0A286DNU2_9ACTN|nr:NAD(P)-dependent oxidoreductase [Streptomyces zhaozhouensis]SOD60290.1 3-hydroxyisobutyrate dehydrogenase [Streptomyces zhaozhouensis]
MTDSSAQPSAPATPSAPSSTEATSVAVLGTGIMGAAMARNLCRADLDVRVWNRTRAKAEPLVEHGVRVAATPAEAVAGAGVVLTVLHDGEAAAEAIAQAAGAFAPDTVWLQCSTAGLDGLDRLVALADEHGLTLVDAPVLGTRQPAEAGMLTVLAAGPEETRGRLAPVLAAVGSRTLWLGTVPGAATRLKLVCNSWVLAVTHGTAEAMALAHGLGVDSADFLEAVAGGPLDLGYLRTKAAAIEAGDLPASFAVDTARKDARLIVEAGERAGVRLDVAAAGLDRLDRASAQGHGDRDMAASYYASFDA